MLRARLGRPWKRPPRERRVDVQRRAAERCAQPRRAGVWAPHLSPSFPQPYPCAEDEECSTDEYCSSPARAGGAGVQVCLACRKRRKRCMRHAMCCPGNYCKNGESWAALQLQSAARTA